MKRVYNKPVLEVESFVTEDIMEDFNEENVLSRGVTTGLDGGYNPGDGFINFHTGDGNVLNSIEYSTFNQ